jgi:hypothetical protein
MMDVVLYKEPEGVQVAVESEFRDNVGDLLYDFKKLLVIKAALKIFILDSRRRDARWFLDPLEELCKAFEQHSPGEIYYILDFHQGRVDVYREVVPKTAIEGSYRQFRLKPVAELNRAPA